MAGLKKSRKISKAVSTLLVLLCSFTLLGSEWGKPTSLTSIQLRKAREGYAALRTNVGRAVSEGAARQTYAQAADKFGPSKVDVLVVSANIHKKASSFREVYRENTEKYGVHDRSSQELFIRSSALETYQFHSKPAAESSTSFAQRHAESGEPPGNVTVRDINDAEKSVEQYRVQQGSRWLTLLKNPAGKEISVELPDLALEQLEDGIFEGLFEAYPFFKPVVGVFTSTFNGRVKTRIKAKIDALTDSLLRSPDRTGQILSEGSSELTQALDVEVSPALQARRDKALENMVTEVDQFKAARVKLINLRRAAIDRILDGLTNSNLEVRNSAAAHIADFDDQLSEAQAKRLVSMMRNDSRKFRVSAEREGHCTVYTYRTERGYAAQAITNCRSRYITASVREEAERKQNESGSERVTDPGWV